MASGTERERHGAGPAFQNVTELWTAWPTWPILRVEVRLHHGMLQLLRIAEFPHIVYQPQAFAFFQGSSPLSLRFELRGELTCSQLVVVANEVPRSAGLNTDDCCDWLNTGDC